MLFGSAHILSSLYDVVESVASSSFIDSVPLIGADPNRVSIIFSMTAGTTGTVSTIGNNIAASGIGLSQQSPTVMLNIHDHPALVQAAWFLPPNASAYTVSVFTVSEHPTDVNHYE